MAATQPPDGGGLDANGEISGEGGLSPDKVIEIANCKLKKAAT